MRIINIDRSWTRLVRWGCRLFRRPRLAQNRAARVGAALPVSRTAIPPLTGRDQTTG